jgi:hypothetical protein
MAARRHPWTLTETKSLIENYDKPIQELVELFPKHSSASINRKINRLRKEGKIGYKSDQTVKDAYKKRHA